MAISLKVFLMILSYMISHSVLCSNDFDHEKTKNLLDVLLQN